MEQIQIANWPVIISNSLEGSDFFRVLRSKMRKIRVSSSTLEDTVIFPLSGLAFLILPLHSLEIPRQTGRGDKANFELINKFTSIHKKCYVLAYAPIHGQKEVDMFAVIQRTFLDTRLQMLPIHNANEGVNGMINIAKMLCKPTSELLFRRLSALVDVTADVIPSVLESIGLTSHQASVLQDGLGSLQNIACADIDQLLDCSLDLETAHMVRQYFIRPRVSPLTEAED